MVITFYNTPDEIDGPERSKSIETPHAQLTYQTLRFREDGADLARFDTTVGLWRVAPDFVELVGGEVFTDIVIGQQHE